MAQQSILYFIVYIVSCGRCDGDDIIVWYMRRVLGYVSNPSARPAAASAAPGGCCSLLYHLFYLSNDGNAVGYKQSELGLDKNFGLSV